MQTIDLVKKIVEALEDKKAEDITVLDIGEVSSIADYFIIANGNNANQLTAMEDAVDEAMYTNGVHQKQVEGTGNSTWILMDYQDIIVHLFSKEDRQFYDLDRIWRDGKEINIEELKAEFFERNEEVESFNDGLKDKLDKFYGFIEDVYGKAEEITLFTTELAAGRSGMYFIT